MRIGKRTRIGAFGAAVSLTTIAFLLLGGGALRAREEAIYKNLDILCDVISIIQKDYIEKVSSEKLTHGALRGMLRSLDGFSYYVPAGGEKTVSPDQTGGELEKTYGLEVAYKGKVLTVVAPVEGGPAWKAGLRHDDKIIKINEKPVAERPLHELYELFRGRAAEEIKLQVIRKGAHDFLDFTLAPGSIDAPRASGKVLDGKIGFVRVTRFDKETGKAVSGELERLEKEGVTGLIIDLRDCPGGDIGAAVDVAGRFIPRGKMITSVTGKREGAKREYKSPGRLLVGEDIPIVVLANEGTSGAAEVLAAALRGSRNAVLMGSKTFGSAYEEGTFTLGDGSVIKLVTGIYLTPGGEEIQGKGLEPDIEMEIPEMEEAPAPGEEAKKEEKEEKKEVKKEEEKAGGGEDPVVQGAVDLIKGIRIITTEKEEGA